jgi:outer membrane protein assembly factor BamB
VLRRLLRAAGLTLAGIVATGAVLYLFFGLRIVLDGGGVPRLRFVESAAAQAERVKRHRESQRAPAPAVAAPSPPQPAQPTAPPISQPAPATAAVGTPAVGMPAAYWTDFRGPRRDGAYREGPIRADWPAAGLTPLWKQPIGGGYASFVIAGGRAFTIEQRGHEEVATAYDVATGRELWANRWTALFAETLGGDGPRATPTWFDGRVYALGGAGELRALDATTGGTIWRTNILGDSAATNLQWGMSASPLIVDDTVVVLPGGRSDQSVVAYDRRTGARRWSALSDQAAYVSPMLVTLAGVRQILIVTALRLAGITADRGELLWEYPWPAPNGIAAAQPIVIGDNRVYLSTGYGTGAAVVELAKTGDRFSVREVWRGITMKNRFAAAVLRDGYIYGLDEAILACIDAATGTLKWKGGRYGYGQVVLAGDHLIVLTEDGDLALVGATPERHQEIARFHVLDGKTWNHPALAGGYLLVRNLAEMAAFDLRR